MFKFSASLSKSHWLFFTLLVRIVVASSSSAAAAPQLVALAFLDGLVFLTGVPLAWGYDKTCIDYLAFVQYKSKSAKIFVKLAKQEVECAGLGKGVLESPHCLLVGNIIHTVYVKEVPETYPVLYEVLYLLVARSVQTLQEHHFHHENRGYLGFFSLYCAVI